MNRDAIVSSSERKASANRARAVSAAIERLEYRIAENAAEPEHSGGIASTGLLSLVDEWARPAVTERPAPETAANIPVAAVSAERQWQQERAMLETRFAEQGEAAHQAIAAAREEGRREGTHTAEAALQAERHQLQRQIAETLEEFRLERDRYFHSVEREVVRLALAIAARVLHRQAQMDPLFLAGAVRVALDKLAGTTGASLHVASAQVPAWQQLFREQGDARLQPEIMADDSLLAGECVLHTRLGTVELGVQAQLEEIEKGFFDLLQHHPSTNRSFENLGQSAIS